MQDIDLNIVELLNEKNPTLKTATAGNNVARVMPLHNAAQYNNLELLKKLVDLGVNIKSTGRRDQTAMHYAAYTNINLEIAEFLREQLNEIDEFGDTPLHIAVRENSEATAEILVDLGADRTILNKVGLAPLHIAVISGNHWMIDILLQNPDLDLDLKNKDGDVAINQVHTVESEDPEILLERKKKIFAKLVRAGANTSVVGSKGLTTFQQVASKAIEDGNFELFDYLSEQAIDHDLRDLIQVKIKAGKLTLEKLKFMVDKLGCDINYIDKNNQTPLQVAVQKNDEAAINILFECGAKSEIVAKSDKTEFLETSSSERPSARLQPVEVVKNVMHQVEKRTNDLLKSTSPSQAIKKQAAASFQNICQITVNANKGYRK